MRPSGIRGLQWLPTSVPRAVECAFANDADARTVHELLGAIPRRGGLRFFDYLYHGEPPHAQQASIEPGAIFCVYRRLRGDLLATCGNHGWTSPWTPVSQRQLREFVLGCLDSNRGDGPRSRTMLLETRAAWVPHRDAVDPRGSLLVRRDVWANWRRA